MEPEHNHADHDDHDHPHPTRPDDDGTLTYYQAMEVAVRELLIDKGILTADDVRRQVEDMDDRNAGARGEGGSARMGRCGVQGAVVGRR